MTVGDIVLKKVKSGDSLCLKKYSSPPPELEEAVAVKKKKKSDYKYSHVRGVVDTTPPRYDPARLGRSIPEYHRRILQLYAQNIRLVTAIKNAHFKRGRVDSRWDHKLVPSQRYYKQRVDFCRRVQAENRVLYQRILGAQPRIAPTRLLRREWDQNRLQIIHRAQAKFVLFPPMPTELIEDAAFAPPPGVKRPRVLVTLRVRNRAVLGVLRLELFSEVCPHTCRLFLELMDGDGLGHGYVGTCFYRKVPGLYWSGGDVIHDNGCGCYAQRGRREPIGAENFHFPHSMPGLLSMRVTRDDEMCGMFNITFKPLPQFDLNAVVFGRVIRPCDTFSSMQVMGSALSTQPVVVVAGAKRRVGQRWVYGEANTRIARNRLRH